MNSVTSNRCLRTVCLLFIILNTGVIRSEPAGSPSRRIYSDDATCICGVDSALLGRLETLFNAASSRDSPLEQATDSQPATSNLNQPSSGSLVGDYAQNSDSPSASRRPSGDRNQPTSDRYESQPSRSRPTNQKDEGSNVSGSRNPNGSAKSEVELSDEPNRADNSGHSVGPTQSNWPYGSNSQRPPQNDESNHVITDLSAQDSPHVTSGPANTGFLDGLTLSPASSDNQALAKLNQSSQSVSETDLTNALESTVPNLVSNIFSNIKNLTIQTEKNPNKPQPSTLTSIDGSSVEIGGDSKDQITANGERLFNVWLEHQIETLNLTAVMANRIRKSAGVLFKRIIKQYVERVERMGGSIESNVQRATQAALNNTQTLIAFLLKNYVNFAAGMMQIIGEQVSRVGRQLDSTGDTIAHVNLNPFDIISNVIESLPNPSDYSNYFRTVGKQIMGEIHSFGGGGGVQQNNNGEEATKSSSSEQTAQPSQTGLITKTIGAIGKLGSWFG